LERTVKKVQDHLILALSKWYIKFGDRQIARKEVANQSLVIIEAKHELGKKLI
jgi:hypothetical protein